MHVMPPSRQRRLPELRLAVQYPAGQADAPTRPQVRRWLRAACALPAEITVRFVAAAEGRQLNQQWRGKDYATNVLSFPYLDDGERIAGDLALCVPVVLAEATEQGKTAEAHFAHLIVHGMLHLQGYDHETNAVEAARMEARERDILHTLGYPDPYD
jgi:probable rRNA maturation factor